MIKLSFMLLQVHNVDAFIIDAVAGCAVNVNVNVWANQVTEEAQLLDNDKNNEQIHLITVERRNMHTNPSE